MVRNVQRHVQDQHWYDIALAMRFRLPVIMHHALMLCSSMRNAVVNTHNWEENMSEEISNLAPVRWKVFQCLLIDGENFGEEAKRNAESFSITTLQFNHFIQRHKTTNPKPVPENNEDMRNSYLILDEKMRFLDNTSGSKVPSNSILDVGIPDALNHSGFDERAFFKRGGRYRWSKSPVDPRDDW